MWSHYASAHTGVCQIFDAKDKVIGEAQEIVYLGGYPSLDFPASDDETDMLTPALLTKASYWQYEREFRVIAKEGAAEDSGFLRCHEGYVDIEAAALLGLILGCQMHQSQQDEVIAIAKAAKHDIKISGQSWTRTVTNFGSTNWLDRCWAPPAGTEQVVCPKPRLGRNAASRASGVSSST